MRITNVRILAYSYLLLATGPLNRPSNRQACGSQPTIIDCLVIDN